MQNPNYPTGDPTRESQAEKLRELGKVFSDLEERAGSIYKRMGQKDVSEGWVPVLQQQRHVAKQIYEAWLEAGGPDTESFLLTQVGLDKDRLERGRHRGLDTVWSDVVNMVTKGRLFRLDDPPQEIWETMEKYPLPHVEDHYGDINNGNERLYSYGQEGSRLLVYVPEVVRDLNKVIDILNSTRDIVVFKRALNRFMSICKRGDQLLYLGDEFSPDLFNI